MEPFEARGGRRAHHLPPTTRSLAANFKVNSTQKPWWLLVALKVRLDHPGFRWLRKHKKGKFKTHLSLTSGSGTKEVKLYNRYSCVRIGLHCLEHFKNKRQTLQFCNHWEKAHEGSRLFFLWGRHKRRESKAIEKKRRSLFMEGITDFFTRPIEAFFLSLKGAVSSRKNLGVFKASEYLTE